MILGILRAGLALGAALFLNTLLPVGTHAHAALSRSDPSAGAALTEPPAEIRLWFTEPLEASYTGAELFDGAGEAVPGITFSIAPDDVHQLIVTLPPDLPDDGYTVAWRTLSAADGHTLQGYFGFRIGAGVVGKIVPPPAGSAAVETARALTRSLALLGLAAIVAVAPLMLGVFGPAAQTTAAFGNAIRSPLRRYSALAAALALLGSVAALAAQAAAIFPTSSLPIAMVSTLAETRYGQLWLLRLVLLLLCMATIVIALWGPNRWRRPASMAGIALAFALPLPFSLLSHAAAQQEGRQAAIAADAFHLLSASVWTGGLFMLALVLLPALRPLSAGQRWQVLRAVIPRFSVLGLAAWGVLALSGLYAIWLQVGTIPALQETPYGQALLLKGALLLPVLALAMFHLVLGRSDLERRGRRFAVTLAAEALLVVAVMLVVGRLIGLEPARETLAGRTPAEIVASLAFATNDSEREGQITISPGATGINSFTLEIEGAPLPEGSQGALRFELPDRGMGAQELLLPEAGPNRFQAEGPELALPGSWRIQTVVRAIGAYSWTSEVIVPIDETPPPAAEPNPAPLFAPVGIGGMIAIAIGAAGLAAAVASHSAPMTRRGSVAATGAIALAAGAVILVDSRISLPDPVQASSIAQVAPVAVASPAAIAAHDRMMTHHDHATPSSSSATPEPLPGPGTPVSGEGISVTIATEPESAGPIDVTVKITDEDGSAVAEARVVLLSDMPAMAMGRMETPAVETEPGRYLAEFVPLGMPGEWHLTVRVSPRGASTQVFSFVVRVP